MTMYWTNSSSSPFLKSSLCIIQVWRLLAKILVSSTFSWESIKINLFLLSSVLNWGYDSENLSINIVLSYSEHWIKKCCSLSTWSGQCGQNLCSLGVIGMLCLPVSILRMWSDSLNFERVTLCFLFLIVSRYFSHLTSLLNCL